MSTFGVNSCAPTSETVINAPVASETSLFKPRLGIGQSCEGAETMAEMVQITVLQLAMRYLAWPTWHLAYVR